MEPITIIVVGLFCFVRYGVTDAIAAARGTEPARVAARRERAERSAARTGPSVSSALAARLASLLDPRAGRRAHPPGPLRRYLTALWRDCWEHAGEVHVRREEQRKAGTLPRQRFARWASGQAQDWWERRTGQPQRVRARRADRCEFCTDPDCRGECVEPADWTDDPTPAAPSDPAPDAAPFGYDGDELDDPDWWETAPTTTAPPPRPEATVHPIRPEGTPTMSNSSSQLDGEVYNPASGARLCDGIAANSAQVAAVLDTSTGSVTGHVDDEVLSSLAKMREHATLLQQEAEKLAGVFRQQVNAADAARAAGVKDDGYLHA